MGDAAVEPAGDARDEDTIPISALQHAVYCLRQAALIHLEQMWAENRFTAEGHVLHLATHAPGTRRRRGVRRVTALPLSSHRLGIAGLADVVEFHVEAGGETPYPIEYKRGKTKLHRADEVQLCAQALCLEEMTGKTVPEGALFYVKTKRRFVVSFDAELRTLTKETIVRLRQVFVSGRTPAAIYRSDRCPACSLIELCRPKAVTRPAHAWRDRMIAALLDQGEIP